MKPHHPSHRSAGKGAVVARAAVVLGLAAAVGLLAQGEGAEPAEDIASGAACARGIFAPAAAL